MPTVYVRQNESLDEAINRFSRYTEKEGILADFRQQTSFRTKHDIERYKEKLRDKKRRQRAKK